MKPVLAVTVGDYNGIGPEVALKGIRNPLVRQICTPVLFGPAGIFESYARRLGHRVRFREVDRAAIGTGRSMTSGTVPVFGTSSFDASQISPGRQSPDAGTVAARAIEEAVRCAMEGEVDAVVTAPVSKQALHAAGIDFPGQTEMLQHLTSSPGVVMMLVAKTMRVGLVTIHHALRDIASVLTRELLRDRIAIVYRALKVDWNIKHPRLAVLGLNPHAGEGGHLGIEERDLILPVMREFLNAGMLIAGPFPADGFFARYKPGTYDAVVAMYHDQGLIPLKMSAGGKAVNFSAGLPIVRTSPDHGTGFDIAGKGRADPGSMIEAMKLAALIAKRRNASQRKVS